MAVLQDAKVGDQITLKEDDRTFKVNVLEVKGESKTLYGVTDCLLVRKVRGRKALLLSAYRDNPANGVLFDRYSGAPLPVEILTS